jgi:hypothetical protein
VSDALVKAAPAGAADPGAAAGAAAVSGPEAFDTACAGRPIVATSPEDIAITTPPRPRAFICPVTAVLSDDSGVFGRTDARWRDLARVVTVNLSDAYEVSCRVRVGEVTRPSRRPRERSPFGLHPKERLATPRSGSPASVMRKCADPGTVTELGVCPWSFSEGEKRCRTYRKPAAMSHLDHGRVGRRGAPMTQRIEPITISRTPEPRVLPRRRAASQPWLTNNDGERRRRHKAAARALCGTRAAAYTTGLSKIS